jgi:hypothetical protein
LPTFAAASRPSLFMRRGEYPMADDGFELCDLRVEVVAPPGAANLWPRRTRTARRAFASGGWASEAPATPK